MISAPRRRFIALIVAANSRVYPKLYPPLSTLMDTHSPWMRRQRIDQLRVGAKVAPSDAAL
jgi:hypothetical protein